MKILAVFFIFIFKSKIVFTQNYSSILLIDIQALNFTRGLYTTANRLPAILQLECTGGTAGCDNQPSFVKCFNYGVSGNTVEWQCQALITSGVTFGQLIVSCEGYNSSSDPYVLVGSCGLRYTLERSTDGITTSIIFGVIGGIFLIIIIVLLVVCSKSPSISSGSSYAPSNSYGSNYNSSPTVYFNDNSYQNQSYSGGSNQSVSVGYSTTEVR